MTRTITRICQTIHLDRGIPRGVHPSLVKAADRGGVLAVAAQFRDWYDEAAPGVDIVEFQPIGRKNDEQGQWRWPTREEFESVYMRGFEAFLDQLNFEILEGHDHPPVRASFGCPRKRLIGSDKRDFKRLPMCQIQFDDIGDRAQTVVNWLRGHCIADAVLETVPTDRIDRPRLATRFALPRGYEWFIWRVRADIVRAWVERNESPIRRGKVGFRDVFGLPISAEGTPRLSLYLPAKDCETMTVDTLRRVLPLFVDVSIQGAIPDAHMAALVEWRKAPVQNTTEGVR